jgi:hypothetical protein
MSVLETLTDDERYLFSILQDQSGVDQSEFLFVDRQKPDNCFRVRPYQWGWFRSMDPQQVELSSRTVGKSLGIQLRAVAHVLINFGADMGITAPELNHLEPILQAIEDRLLSCRLTREMLPKGRFSATGGGTRSISHHPFMLSTVLNTRILGRLPQRDGHGVKGLHVKWLELDEAQDYPDRGYRELIETCTGEGTIWRTHGVSSGVGGWFYDISKQAVDTPPLRETPKKSDADWTIHRLVAQCRPDWTDMERQGKIDKYGSRDDPDYGRNVLGLPGPAENIIFVLRRLVKCTDDVPDSPYNQDEYAHITIRDADMQREGVSILDFIQLPVSHQVYGNIYIGMDVGYVNDPSEILVFTDYLPSVAELRKCREDHKAVPKHSDGDEAGKRRFKLLTRISLVRIPSPDQMEVMLYLIDFYKPVAFAMDKTGNGLPLYQDVTRELENKVNQTRSAQARYALSIMKGYNFSENVLVEIDPAQELAPGLTIDEKADEAGIFRKVIEVSTDALRDLVDNERMWLPWDRELIGQFNGQTFHYSKVTTDAYGRRRLFSQGDFHCLDAARMAALAHKQRQIEELLATREAPRKPVLDVFRVMPSMSSRQGAGW